MLLSKDWTGTELGHPSGWPQSLRSIVALILASGKPMFVVWGTARVLLYNDAYVPLLGARHPASLGMPFFSVWPESHGDVAPLFDRLFGGTVVDLEDISISFDRDERTAAAHFALSYTPIRDQGNQVVGLLCIHSDTTDSVAGAVSESRDHKRLSLMFELAPSVIAVLHGAEHRIELANAGFLKLVGDRDILGKAFAEALPEAVAQGYVALLDQAFASGERVTRTDARYAVPEAPGAGVRERFIDFVFQPITDGIGTTTGIFVHGSEVTERVHDETLLRIRESHLNEANADLGRLVSERSAQLRAKEALIQTVYEHSSEYHVILVQTARGVLVVEEMNPAALKAHRASRTDVIGRTVDECLRPAEAAAVTRFLRACLEDNAPRHYEFEYAGKFFAGTASPLPAVAGTGRQIALSARDVTERRNLEEQLRQSQKMEAVGQLTGGLAHDFNNLLSGISGSLELLKMRSEQGRWEELDRYIAAAQGAVQRAAALTHRLLAFARRQNLDAKSVDLNELVAGMHELIRRTVGPAINVPLVAVGEPWTAWVDPNQMENALLNLCINARDAMPAGGVLVIETNTHVLDDKSAPDHDLPPGQYLSLSVSDTGIGMTPETMARAFEPFFTTKPIGTGTGLGLSMIYGFARQSGGCVRMTSALGRGTKVSIFLPRHAGGTAAAVAPRSGGAAARVAHGETVLVVDDEPTVRMLAVEVLRDLGYVALEAADGAEALLLVYSTRRIDLLITDIGLPGVIDGRQLSDAARACRPRLRVLLITGYAGVPRDADAQSGLQILAKPFSIQELTERVADLMRP